MILNRRQANKCKSGSYFKDSVLYFLWMEQKRKDLPAGNVSGCAAPEVPPDGMSKVLLFAGSFSSCGTSQEDPLDAAAVAVTHFSQRSLDFEYPSFITSDDKEPHTA